MVKRMFRNIVKYSKDISQWIYVFCFAFNLKCYLLKQFLNEIIANLQFCLAINHRLIPLFKFIIHTNSFFLFFCLTRFDHFVLQILTAFSCLKQSVLSFFFPFNDHNVLAMIKQNFFIFLFLQKWRIRLKL